jgi:DNA polymerase delta subunit 1
VNPTDVNRISEDKFKKSENGHCFVHSNVKKGILPTILEELLSGKLALKAMFHNDQRFIADDDNCLSKSS